MNSYKYIKINDGNYSEMGINITPDAHHYCVSGCGGVESAHHLFLSCNNFGFLWTL